MAGQAAEIMPRTGRPVAMLLRISNAARAPLPRRQAAPLPPIAEAGTELVERPS